MCSRARGRCEWIEGRVEGKEGRQESCCWKMPGREGALKGKPAIPTTAVVTEGSLIKEVQPSPRFCSSIACPKHKLSSGSGQLKVKGGRGRKKGGGLSRGAKHCAQLNPLPWNRKASQDRTNAPPQSSLRRVHRYFPKEFQTNIQNIPLLPRSVLPAALGVCLCLRTRCVRPGESRRVRDIRRSCGRPLRRSTRWYTRRSRLR